MLIAFLSKYFSGNSCSYILRLSSSLIFAMRSSCCLQNGECYTRFSSAAFSFSRSVKKSLLSFFTSTISYETLPLRFSATCCKFIKSFIWISIFFKRLPLLEKYGFFQIADFLSGTIMFLTRLAAFSRSTSWHPLCIKCYFKNNDSFNWFSSIFCLDGRIFSWSWKYLLLFWS